MKSSATAKKKSISPGAFVANELKRHWQLYVMLILPLTYLIIFAYIPMGGVIIAFKDYSIRGGIWGSDWVGFEHFINSVNVIPKASAKGSRVFMSGNPTPVSHS